MSKSKKVRIGDFCRARLIKGQKVSTVIKAANKREDGGKVNKAHIAWYLWDMRKRGMDMPAIYAK